MLLSLLCILASGVFLFFAVQSDMSTAFSESGHQASKSFGMYIGATATGAVGLVTGISNAKALKGEDRKWYIGAILLALTAVVFFAGAGFVSGVTPFVTANYGFLVPFAQVAVVT